MEIFNPTHLVEPHWNGRNKIIAKDLLEPNKTILDIGCGERPILKFYKPLKYIGVDGIPSADIVLDLNTDFILPNGWDYVICSGIFEYIDFPDQLMKKLVGLGKEYIFTWWTGLGYGRAPHQVIKKFIEQEYIIIDEKNWGNSQKIYKCIMKNI